MKPRSSKRRKPSRAQVNAAFAKHDAQAVERFAAGASAMLEAYDREYVEPLRQRVAELEAFIRGPAR